MRGKRWFSFVVFILGLWIAEGASASSHKIVTGTQNLITDATGWVLILLPIAAALSIGWQSFLKVSCEGDPAVIAQKNKIIKSILVGAAIGEAATGIVNLVVGYYK